MPEDQALVLSKRANRIKPSPIAMISQQAESMIAQGQPIINLSIGEPDFDTPEHIKEAAIKAIRDGHTKYTAVDGISELKQAIINKLARENKLTYAPNEIIVSCGAKHSIYNLLTAVIDHEDEVIIPAPYWASYPDMALLTDGTPVIVTTDAANRFKMTPQQLEAAITPKSRLILLNSPSNPTGIAYNESELKALAEVLLRHPRILIASDDIYEHTLFRNQTFHHILNASPELKERTIVINSVSKTYAMTGWRIGYAAGSSKIVNAMKKAQSQSTSNATSISQYATIAALNGDQECVRTMARAYEKRHDYLVQALKTIPGFEPIVADGTFYSFPSIAPFLKAHPSIKDDVAFAAFLLNEAQIAAVPGSAFGAPNHIRFSYVTSMENLEKAVTRLKEAMAKQVIA